MIRLVVARRLDPWDPEQEENTAHSPCWVDFRGVPLSKKQRDDALFEAIFSLACFPH